MFINSKLAKSIRLAIAAGAVATVFSSSSIFAQEAEEEVEEEVSDVIERVEVTGSRIRRVDLEGALPITVIDRAAIEYSGQTSVADLLRNTSFNSTGSFRPQSGSSAQGVSSVNLRGLGSSRTLVLVDGRRLPKSPSTGSSQDLNAIPVAAVERVEILTDGASAIYGSDAIGGVINIITRKDFNGVELKLGATEVEHEGGSREEGSIVFGTSSDKGSIIGGVSWNNRDIIFARDLPWYSPGGSVFGNSFTTLTDGVDDFNWTSLPGACNDGPGFYQLASGGALANSAGTQERCAYDYALESADEASTGVIGFFMNSRYDINDDWSIFSSMSINKTSSFGRYAPVPDSTYYTGNALTVDSPNNPTNPNSSMYDAAFGAPQEVNWWHRFDSLGNRDSEVDNELSDLTVGAEGQLGDMFIDFGVRRTKNKTYDIGRNYLVRSTAEAYIEDGTYDLSDPSGNSDDVLNAMKAVISRISSYDQDEAFASVQFDMFDMDAGAVTTFIGAEYRKEIYSDQYDSLSEAGQIGGSAGNSAGGGRNSKAIFFETLIPVLDELEVSVAGRYDSYSDYGSDFSPKISLKYTPIDDLIIRSSFGKGFRAPSLDILTQKDSFSATSVSDVRTCQAQSQPDDCSTQINNIIVANPELQSEQSNQFALGFAYEPIDNLSFSVDYFDIEITNRITSFGASTILARDQAGDFIPPGLGVTRAGNGAILEVISGYGNEGTRQTEGLDLNVRYMVETDFGTIRSNFQTFYGLSDKVDGGRDFYNDPGQPNYRGVWSNIYTLGDFDVAYNMNFIASTAEDIVDGLDDGHIPSWITHDLQVNYNAPWNAKITIGSSNITGKEPPLFAFGGRDYNFNLYDGYGRVVYARYTQSF